jgi:hypothetical protein
MYLQWLSFILPYAALPSSISLTLHFSFYWFLYYSVFSNIETLSIDENTNNVTTMAQF